VRGADGFSLRDPLPVAAGGRRALARRLRTVRSLRGPGDRRPLQDPLPGARGRAECTAASKGGVVRRPPPGRAAGDPVPGTSRTDGVFTRRPGGRLLPGAPGRRVRSGQGAPAPGEGTDPLRGARFPPVLPVRLGAGRLLPDAGAVGGRSGGDGGAGARLPRAGDVPRHPATEAGTAGGAPRGLARPGRAEPAADRGARPHPPRDQGVLPGLLRSYDPADGHGGDVPGNGVGAGGRIHVRRLQPDERDHEGAHRRGDHLHSPDLHRGGVRDELRHEGVPMEHAGTHVGVRVPRPAAPDGGRRGRDAVLLPPEAVDLTRSASLRKKAFLRPICGIDRGEVTLFFMQCLTGEVGDEEEKAIVTAVVAVLVIGAGIAAWFRFREGKEVGVIRVSGNICGISWSSPAGDLSERGGAGHAVAPDRGASDHGPGHTFFHDATFPQNHGIERTARKRWR